MGTEIIANNPYVPYGSKADLPKPVSSIIESYTSKPVYSGDGDEEEGACFEIT